MKPLFVISGEKCEHIPRTVHETSRSVPRGSCPYLIGLFPKPLPDPQFVQDRVFLWLLCAAPPGTVRSAARARPTYSRSPSSGSELAHHHGHWRAGRLWLPRRREVTARKTMDARETRPGSSPVAPRSSFRQETEDPVKDVNGFGNNENRF